MRLVGFDDFGRYLPQNQKPSSDQPVAVDLRTPMRSAFIFTKVTKMMSTNTAQNPMRILVTDDEPDILEMTVKILANAGYAVTAASGHSEFMFVFNRSPLPNLIVMDVRMPEHDGFWIAERVKSAYNIPIIFMSAYHCPKYQLYALIAGASSCINKPFEPAFLLNEVKKALLDARPNSDGESMLFRSRLTSASGTALTTEQRRGKAH